MSNISTTSLFDLIKESELNFIWKCPLSKRYIFFSIRIVLLAFGKTIMKQYFHLLFSLKFIRAFWKVGFFENPLLVPASENTIKTMLKDFFWEYYLLVSFFKLFPYYLYFRICCKIAVFCLFYNVFIGFIMKTLVQRLCLFLCSTFFFKTDFINILFCKKKCLLPLSIVFLWFPDYFSRMIKYYMFY